MNTAIISHFRTDLLESIWTDNEPVKSALGQPNQFGADLNGSSI